MKERPILFSAPMVRAILDGRKHVTRRIVKNEFGVCGECWTNAREPMCVPHNDGDGGMGIFGTAPYLRVAFCEHNDRCGGRTRCPYGVPGDRLWVRETWRYSASRYCHCPQGAEPDSCDDWKAGIGCASVRTPPVYAATSNERGPWRPSIFMPRWASRITLEITGVRVERLQAITEEDARAEGVDGSGPVGYIPAKLSMGACRYDFASLWDGINADRAPWSSNPWVWVLSFRRVLP